jgi:hypothetical protein
MKTETVYLQNDVLVVEHDSQLLFDYIPEYEVSEKTVNEELDELHEQYLNNISLTQRYESRERLAKKWFEKHPDKPLSEMYIQMHEEQMREEQRHRELMHIARCINEDKPVCIKYTAGGLVIDDATRFFELLLP